MKSSAAVQISRLLVGLLFIFSGLIKANDPVGFAVKLEDYYLLFAQWLPFFGGDLVMGSVVAQAIFLVVLEVGLGVGLLLGVWRNLIAWLLLLLILFFTWLTGFSAITGEVQDCGCFGDAIPLTPWQSFYKDLVLLVLILVIFIGRKRIKPLLGSAAGNVLLAAGCAFTLWVSVHAVRHLPFIDFRPYKVGNNIADLMAVPDDAPQEVIEITWTYRNKETGELKEFAGDPPSDLEVWEFAGREDKIIQEAFIPEIHDFVFTDIRGEMAADRLLALDMPVIYFISPSLDKLHPSGLARFLDFQRGAAAEGFPSFVLAAATSEDLLEWREQIGASDAPGLFTLAGDEKGLKTMVRTNPGVLLVHKGLIMGKWSWRNLPEWETIRSGLYPGREATPLPEWDAPVGAFQAGDHIPSLMNAGHEPEAEFFVTDSEGNDATDALLGDTAARELLIVRSIFEVSAESNTALVAYMEGLVAADRPFLVLTGASADEIEQLRAHNGIPFDALFCDAEFLEKVISSNTGGLLLKAGTVLEKWDESSGAPATE